LILCQGFKNSYAFSHEVIWVSRNHILESTKS